MPQRPAARSSVKRAASLVAEKQLLSLVSGQPGGPLTDAEFLEELRTEAQRHGIAPPALVADDCEDAVVVGGEAQQQTCGAIVRGAALRRPQRQQRRLRRRVPRTRAARALPAAGEVVDDGDLTRKHAFLTRDEELELCAAVKRGADLEQLSGDVAALDGPDVKAAQLARQGAQRWAAAAGEASVETLQAALVAAERAKAELVTAHMGYLRKLAMQFSRQGVDDEDLVCVAIDALVQAAGTFSAERGTRLLTYAWFYIMRDLTDALRLQGSAVVVPQRAMNRLRMLRKAEGALAQRLGRKPTAAELAEKVGCSEAAWHKLQAAARAASCRRWETLSYGGQGGERGDGNDTISAGDLAGAMHEEDEAPQLREDKRKCLEELLEVALELLPHGAQRQALRLRYGLADGRPRTLREVGAGMRPPRSVETARQLVADGQAGLGRVLGRLRLTGAMEQHAASVP